MPISLFIGLCLSGFICSLALYNTAHHSMLTAIRSERVHYNRVKTKCTLVFWTSVITFICLMIEIIWF